MKKIVLVTMALIIAVSFGACSGMKYRFDFEAEDVQEIRIQEESVSDHEIGDILIAKEFFLAFLNGINALDYRSRREHCDCFVPRHIIIKLKNGDIYRVNHDSIVMNDEEKKYICSAADYNNFLDQCASFTAHADA